MRKEGILVEEEVTTVVATIAAKVETNLILSLNRNRNHNHNHNPSLNPVQTQDLLPNPLIPAKKTRQLRVVHLSLLLIHALKIPVQKAAVRSQHHPARLQGL
jgi:hypothetical protein